jgi:hypothetical protein
MILLSQKLKIDKSVVSEYGGFNLRLAEIGRAHV